MIQLIMMINARKSFTVQELADEFGLSKRTIARDLDELSSLGVPVYSVQGRGGGYRLLQERLLPPISFTESEAVALFFACQSLDYFSSVPFGEGAETALNKFYYYLPTDVKDRIDRLKNKVMIWSPYRPMSTEVLNTLMQAIMMKSVVTVEYSSRGGATKRDIQPIGLYASSGYWYCPAFCFLREEIRQFRVDRIGSATLNESISCREDVDQLSLLDKPVTDQLEQIVLRLAFTSQGVWQVESNARFAPFLERMDDGSGAADVPIAHKDFLFHMDLLWKLGEDVTVLGPEEAIQWMRSKIESLSRLYL
ncbi:helix-turn-helix transcriptional regulator [Paenibacillus harenae]|uniref:helix-turn-helix transcriptional regulator n=1 Tax=Paenibacillus harenae TaxID=306543 RepID=UPI00278CD915|nr:YafY family protein [Paenibacillus harenae]MDQ0061721.1 putative DNA-binding transcriptional regulator YafY [Paenibacillus harenae]